MSEIRYCEWCKKPFEATHTKKYCTYQCKLKKMYERKRNERRRAKAPNVDKENPLDKLMRAKW